jgi:hypothetical protein
MSEIKRMMSENRRLLVGTCAMEKKVEGKPMHALMKRLQVLRSHLSCNVVTQITTLGLSLFSSCIPPHPHPFPDLDENRARVQAKGDMEWVKFGDDCILNKPVEEWPKCDALIAFYSDGFPLEKVALFPLFPLFPLSPHLPPLALLWTSLFAAHQAIV